MGRTSHFANQLTHGTTQDNWNITLNTTEVFLEGWRSFFEVSEISMRQGKMVDQDEIFQT